MQFLGVCCCCRLCGGTKEHTVRDKACEPCLTPWCKMIYALSYAFVCTVFSPKLCFRIICCAGTWMRACRRPCIGTLRRGGSSTHCMTGCTSTWWERMRRSMWSGWRTWRSSLETESLCLLVPFCWENKPCSYHQISDHNCANIPLMATHTLLLQDFLLTWLFVMESGGNSVTLSSALCRSP